MAKNSACELGSTFCVFVILLSTETKSIIVRQPWPCTFEVYGVKGLWAVKHVFLKLPSVRTAHCEQSREAKESASQVQHDPLTSVLPGKFRTYGAHSGDIFYVPLRHSQLQVQLAPKGLPHVSFGTRTARVLHPGLRRLPRPTQYRQYISAVNFWLS